MAQPSAPITTLTFRAGNVEAFPWPETLPPPFGARLVQTPSGPPGLLAPGRMRWRLRHALEVATAGYCDDIATASPQLQRAHLQREHLQAAHGPATNMAIESLRLAGYRGLLHAIPEALRVAIAVALARMLNQRALVGVIDSAACDRWHRQAGPDAALLEVHTFARLAREMRWRGGQQDLLVVDGPEAIPHGVASAVCDASAALARVGFLDRLDAATVERFASSIGPLLLLCPPDSPHEHCAPERPTVTELRVPLPDDRLDRYQAAWHTFLAAYDRFLAARGNVGFGAFLQQARSDPAQRPAVFAWHEAVRLAAWHPGKAAMLGELLRRHDAERMLVFTPDRNSAYEIASAHLMPAVTAELPRAERRALLDAFATGELTALVGPRLLETGVEQQQADVAILVGGGHGTAQRRRRLQRVRPGGRCYELTTLETLEVGRASRWRAFDADAATAVHHG
ncbi:MAG: helicase-related protein [Planctomycetota bacterium]|nr:hypothetical protein [Planctomycetota bacterium]